MEQHEQKCTWWNKPLVRSGTDWWNRPMCVDHSSEVWKPVKGNIGLQFVLLLAASLILDGGLLASIVLCATGAWWIAILPILVRRPKLPKRGEIFFLKFGFLIFLPLSIITIPWWGWLRELL